MSYETPGGRHEIASRLGHGTAAVRAVADQRTFHVPAEAMRDLDDIKKKVRHRIDFQFASADERLTSALAIDGSRDVEQVREQVAALRE